MTLRRASHRRRRRQRERERLEGCGLPVAVFGITLATVLLVRLLTR